MATAKKSIPVEKVGKTHTGMRMNNDQLEKLRFIAEADRRTFTTVIEIAIEDYIAAWEKKNGTITLEKK